MNSRTVTPAVLLAMLTAVPAAWSQAAPDQSGPYTAALLADAAGRTGLQPPDKTAFTLNVHGYMQARYLLNSRDEAPDGDEELTSGFQMRRTRITVDGSLDERWGYKVQGNFSSSSGQFVMTDSYGTFKADDNWTITFGQFKLPFSREELVGATTQLAVDRSIVNTIFTMNRSQGVQAAYQTGDWRVAGAFSDGGNTANMDFTAPGEADYALTARAEWKWTGDWKQFKDFTSFREGAEGGLLGAAAHWQSGGETGGPTADLDTFSATVDVSYENNGWNLFGAGFYRSTDAAGAELADLGILAQGGYFFSDNTELFARYDVAIPDDERASDADPFNTLTIGVNHYFIPSSHAAKFTADVVWFLDSPSETGGLVVPSTGVGLLPDSGDSQAALRLQMQIVF
jgi:hypothetical protein